MTLPFEASRLKIQRARDHIAQLIKSVAQFTERCPIFMNVKLNDRDGNYVDYEVVASEEVPKYFSAIIGDVVDNLRCSLDLLAAELVRLNGGNDKNVYFPFAENANDIDHMIKKRNMHRASAEVVDLIKSFKPYRGGNAALRGIHDLDIMDKHRMLIPSISSIHYPIGGIGAPFGSIKPGNVLSKGTALLSAFAPMGLAIGNRIPVTFRLQIPIKGIPHSDVVPMVQRLADDFACLIDAADFLISSLSAGGGRKTH
jgi:hypothetical protein